MTSATVSPSIDDPVNRAILAVSEDRLQGFRRDPLGDIATLSGIEQATVQERLREMLRAGVIRRIRQTLITTQLAEGALVAWEVPQDALQAAFDVLFRDDPFSGHVVIRSTDRETPGSSYRLWTTLKVPPGYSLERHCAALAPALGAGRFRIMPARCMFALGVGHTRRRTLEPGARSAEPAALSWPTVQELSGVEWRVLVALKREFEPDELQPDTWTPRAAEAGLPLADFLAVAEGLDRRGLLGRFSTFLEHVKPLSTGERVTRYNALFHWAVPPGREIDAGREVGRHHVITHAYWREAGPEFGNVNVMAVAHGMDRDRLIEHKSAIDVHLAEAGVAIGYTNVFWGGRSEIKPSEISPAAFREWWTTRGVDPETLRAGAGQ